jgi:hypothetical protein
MKKTPALWKEKLLIFPALWKEELLIFPTMKSRIQIKIAQNIATFPNPVAQMIENRTSKLRADRRRFMSK